MKNLILLLSAFILFPRCNQRHEDGSFSAQYTRLPLKDFPDPIIALPSATAVELLAYSGGEVDKKADGIN